MSITVAPTCTMAMPNYQGFDSIRPSFTDVVVDVTGDLVHLVVPIPGLLATVRLTFTAEQLGALMDDLIDASELVMS